MYINEYKYYIQTQAGNEPTNFGAESSSLQTAEIYNFQTKTNH